MGVGAGVGVGVGAGPAHTPLWDSFRFPQMQLTACRVYLRLFTCRLPPPRTRHRPLLQGLNCLLSINPFLMPLTFSLLFLPAGVCGAG